MQQMDLWLFLDSTQQQAVTCQINAIAHQLGLPVPLSVILLQVQRSLYLPQIAEVDPKGITLFRKLTEMNRTAIAELFHKTATSLVEFVKTTQEQFMQHGSIEYLIPDFQMFASSESKCPGFKWQGFTPKKGSLWIRLDHQIKCLLQFTLQFMVKTHQMSHLEWQPDLQKTFASIESQLQPLRKQLQNLHSLDEQVTESLCKFKQQQEESMRLYKSEIGEAMTQLESIQKAQEEKQEKEEVMVEEEKEGSRILGFFASTKHRIVDRISQMFAEQQIPFKKQNEADLKNLQQQAELTSDEAKAVQAMCYLSCDVLLERVSRCFSFQELSRLEFTLKKPVIDWEGEEMLLVGTGSLVELNHLRIRKYRENLAKVLRAMELGDIESKDRFFVLALLFYRALEGDYSTLARRYLGKVLQAVQTTFEQQKCSYLRAALRIFETAHLKPSQFALKLQSQMPYRSLHFKQSQKSRLIRQTQYLGNKCTPGLGQEKQCLKKGQNLQFQRLNYAKPSKNVTFLISGFLSQDTQKDLQWLGVIRALEDTELYGVVWRSGTKLDLVNYIGVAAGALALKGLKVQGGNLVALVEVAQLGLKVANFFARRVEEKQSNPFWGSLINATQTGQELADRLIEEFSDRHITLIGFSMGTQVIAACLQRLIQKKQEKLLLKIVTMGGVADQESVAKLLERSSQPLSWLNFQSKNDYAVKYVYRVCTLGAKPIGSAGLKLVHGHELANWQVGDVVNSHMDFRPNLHGLCLIAGLRHD